MAWRWLARALGFEPPRPVLLVCMRLRDMHVVHPDMDTSHDCSDCGAMLGMYPSGQRVMERYGNRVKLACQVCREFHPGSFQPAPGAVNEVGQSVPRVKPWS